MSSIDFKHISERVHQLFDEAIYQSEEIKIELQRIVRENLEKTQRNIELIEALCKAKGRYNTQKAYDALMTYNGLPSVKVDEPSTNKIKLPQMEVQEYIAGALDLQLKRGSADSCAYDLSFIGWYKDENDVKRYRGDGYVIEPGETLKVRTGIAIALSGVGKVAGMIYPRSGLATKHGIVLANSVGVIDPDYRGELIVALKNISDKPYTINNHDRIAQMVITPFVEIDVLKVNEFSETTERGEGGFGSSGK